MVHHHQHHRPLHARRDPRRVSGGRSPYVYRREAGVEMGFGGHHRFPTLYVSKKLKDKVGLTFHHCPGFKELREDHPDREIDEVKAQSLSTKEFNKEVEKYDEHKKKVDMRRKSVKRDPSTKEIREHLRKIIKYHCQKVSESIPSIYPILGPVNLDDEGDGGGNNGGDKRAGLKMPNTKGELKRY